jgi:hypothetical protein
MDGLKSSSRTAPGVMVRECIRVVLFCAGLISCAAVAQTPQALTVSPAKATMLVGETRTFRAVGKDGRMRHNVRWRISPEHVAAIAVNGSEATVQAREASPSVLLTASSEADSADASIEIRPSGDMPAGTVIWSVSPTPGCKAEKMIQAVPSANGPDLYVQETCTDGTMIRALTADGRELWRQQMGSGGTAPNVATPVAQGPYIGLLPNGLSSRVKEKSEPPAGQHINPHARSVCDAISVGMSKEDAHKAIVDRHVALDARQRPSNTWTIEEEGFRCAISFDEKTGAVVKKKKTVVIE